MFLIVTGGICVRSRLLGQYFVASLFSRAMVSVVSCRQCVVNRASAGRPVRHVHVHVLMYDLPIHMRFRIRRYDGSVQNLS